MGLKGEIIKLDLQFRFEAGTSRGVLNQKTSFIIKVEDKHEPFIFGLGECGPLKGLSIDDDEDLELRLLEVIHRMSNFQRPKDVNQAYAYAKELAGEEFPAVRFALEVAFIDLLEGGRRLIFKNSFSQGLSPISINGLIWMGSKQFMLQQIQEKVAAGFKCIKMKIGAIDFETECSILQFIRNSYPADQIEIRVDANGAFSEQNALKKISRLVKYDLHSIEQPIKPGQIDVMAELCRNSPLPIALDEELIGVYGARKRDLLLNIKPAYIILKPTLLGGLLETEDWISLAEAQQIGWWLTSALESNIGLNAISQFTANYHSSLPQGLGTGRLYHNNIESPLEVSKGEIWYRNNKQWILSSIGL